MTVWWQPVVAVPRGALSVSAAVHADMVPVLLLTVGACVAPQTRLPAGSPLASFGDTCVDLAGMADSEIAPVTLRSTRLAVTESSGGSESPGIRTGERNHRSVCWRALLGLGLRRAARFMRKLQMDGFPGWYHSRGPYQVGHSSAITPDGLPGPPVGCFLRPQSPGRDHPPRYDAKAIVTLRGESPFAALSLAARGPPGLS